MDLHGDLAAGGVTAEAQQEGAAAAPAEGAADGSLLKSDCTHTWDTAAVSLSATRRQHCHEEHFAQ